MMNLTTAKKRLLKNGFTLVKNGSSYNGYSDYYYATKVGVEEAISFQHEIANDVITTIRVRDKDDKAYPASSLAAALKTVEGKLTLNSSSLDELRASIIRRHVAGRFVSEDEILKLKLHSKEEIRIAYEKALSHIFAYRRKVTKNLELQRRKALFDIDHLWMKMIQIHEKMHPTQEHLFKVNVQTNVEPEKNVKINYRQASTISVTVPIFARNASQAMSTAAMMFSSNAKCITREIFAVGTKCEALEAYEKSAKNSCPSKNVQIEIDGIETEITSLQNQINELRASMEYSSKRLERAAMLEMMANTIVMSYKN